MIHDLLRLFRFIISLFSLIFIAASSLFSFSSLFSSLFFSLSSSPQPLPPLFRLLPFRLFAINIFDISILIFLRHYFIFIIIADNIFIIISLFSTAIIIRHTPLRHYFLLFIHDIFMLSLFSYFLSFIFIDFLHRCHFIFFIFMLLDIIEILFSS